MRQSNTWRYRDAKSRLTEVVRRARTGEPQRVVVGGKTSVLVVDPRRYEVREKATETRAELTMADFVRRSRKYRLDIDIEFDRSVYMDFPRKPL